MAARKTICIDRNSHRILLEAKEEMREEGISSPTLSDAIRWINRKARENTSSGQQRKS